MPGQRAEAGKLVTFGIRPTRAETGYGYIRAEVELPGGGRRIGAFVEKPDAPTAERYLASGDCLWNSGIFMMRASVWMAQLRALRPDIVDACKVAFAARSQDRDFLRVGAEAFAACPADSIDYAVMEKLPAGLGVVIPLAAGWSDVGAWDALWQINGKDAEGNVLRGDVMAVDTRGRAGDARRRVVPGVGERVDLHSARYPASPGKPGQGAPRDDCGAVGGLSGRGRYRALRG